MRLEPSTPGEPTPRALTIRLAGGDIADAQASMIVVSHLAGLAPAGATAVIDTVLGGAISRRAAAGALRGRFGTPWFLPTMTSPLAAGCVVVILLGEPEHVNLERLAETGMAVVDAAELAGVRDAATVLHGAGGLAVDPGLAAERVVTGVLDGLTRDPRTPLRDLTIVERDRDKLEAIHSGLLRAVRRLDERSGLTVFVERTVLTPRRRAVVDGRRHIGIPDHLRLGITRSGTLLKVTTTGSGSITGSEHLDYPSDVADDILRDLANELTDQPDAPGRATRFESIGARLHNKFLDTSDSRLDVGEQLLAAPGGQVVLALSPDTVDLPWELLHVDGRFVALSHDIGRHVELPFLGRQSAHSGPREDLRVLVIGDPDGTLPAAAEEARRVAGVLHLNKRAAVTRLISGEDGRRRVTFSDVSRALDTVDFDVLHFAGHGTYHPLQEGQSGLELADRALTANDLAARRWVPRLVVANACHSAGTGPSGPCGPFDGGSATRDMVQQLLVTGTRTFIGAMWKIGDQAAARFAEELYRALLGSTAEEPATVGEAVRRARCALHRELPSGDPTWAAYALYGSPWNYALGAPDT